MLNNLREEIVSLCEKGEFSAAHIALVHNSATPEVEPDIWEFLARRAQSAGAKKVAHSVRRAIWDAHVWTADLAFKEARYFLDAGDNSSARYVLNTVFGAETDDRDARLILAQVQIQELRANPETKNDPAKRDESRALAMSLDIAIRDQSLIAIDLLRMSDNFEHALEICRASKALFPDEIRLQMREARILEQTSDLSAAISILELVAQSSTRYRIEALFKILQLGGRLGNQDLIAEMASKLVLEPLGIDQRLQLALFLRQQSVALALIEVVAGGGYEGQPIDRVTGQTIGQMLLDNGDIGMLALLRRRQIPMGQKILSQLDATGFSVTGTQTMPLTVAEAKRIRSPDFMLPLPRFLGHARRPAGWPGTRKIPERILLVNAYLVIGGAERQFITMIKSLIQAGIQPDALDVAFFSLATDRGHAALLPDLEKLAVRVHDLRERPVVNQTLPEETKSVLNALPLQLREDSTALWHLANEVRPDLIHGWQDRAALASGIVGQLLSTERTVMSFRNMSPATRQDPALLQYSALYKDLANNDAVKMTANASAARKDYSRWIGCAPERIELLPNSIDLRRFASASSNNSGIPKPLKRLRIKGVFRLAPNKRPDLWVNTVAEISSQAAFKTDATIFGNGPLREETLQLGKQLGLKGFDVRSGESRPRQIYDNTDVLLLMSRVEGTPNVVIEAQACGIPVVACDVGGTRDVLHQSGLLLDPEIYPKKAARLILEWLPTAIASPKEDRIAFVRQNFGMRSLAERVETLYCGHSWDAT